VTLLPSEDSGDGIFIEAVVVDVVVDVSGNGSVFFARFG